MLIVAVFTHQSFLSRKLTQDRNVQSLDPGQVGIARRLMPQELPSPTEGQRWRENKPVRSGTVLNYAMQSLPEGVLQNRAPLLTIAAHSLTFNPLYYPMYHLIFASFCLVFCHLTLNHIPHKLRETRSLHWILFPSYYNFIHTLSDIFC